ncbi:MAG TPA: PKD domain-containing protein [Saprospiraceae bacterium]|nr:PKD domain-containing protein [Saprospiraceae bacterium]
MKIKFIILVLFLYSAGSNTAFAQLSNGSPAPDFAVTTITGGSYSLYGAMGANKAACLDFMATWCSPCWSFHQSGVLESVYANLSSETTVVMLEADYSTNTACLYGPSGCVGGTQGNWVSGTLYPICDLQSGDGVRESYQISYFPTLYVISPDKRVWEIISRSYSNYENWITKSFKLNVVSANITNSICGNDGKVDINVTGGYGSLDYSWSNGATSQDLTNVGAGTYEVTITDNNGYFKEFGPYTVGGTQKGMEILSTNVQHNLCHGDAAGSIQIDLDYGTPPYRFLWSNGSVDQNIENLPAGNYSLTITDALNCKLYKSAQITQPAKLLTDFDVVDETCNDENGGIVFQTTGGVQPYRYNIGFGDQSYPEFGGLAAGNYSVTIQDRNDCELVVQFEINGTNKPEALTQISSHINCVNDTVSVVGEGSTQGLHLKYEWSTQNGKIVSNPSQVNIEVDKKGWYVLKVTDLNTYCYDKDSIFVNDLRKFPEMEGVRDSLLNCLTESLNLAPKFSAPHLKYYWTKISVPLFKDTSRILNVNFGGNYIFNLLDTINQCLTLDTVAIGENKIKPQISVVEPLVLNCTINQVNIDASGSSAGPNYSFKWTSSDGNILDGSSLNAMVDSKGNYNLKITDNTNYCNHDSTIIVLEDRTKPTVNAGDVNSILFCQSNSVILDGTKSSSGVRYSAQWTTVDGHIVSGQNTLSPRVDKKGTYTLTVNDLINTCTSAADLLVDEQSSLTSTFEGTATLLSVKFTDKTTGLIQSRLWNFGDGLTSTEMNPEHIYTQDGNYRVCLTVINECGSSESCQEFRLSASAVLTISNWQVQNVSCNGGTNGSIHVIAGGGTPPYIFDWDNGASTSELNNLPAGNYNLVLKDNAGNTYSQSFTVSEPDAIALSSANITHSTGAADGSIDITAQGGTKPYTFLWNNNSTNEDLIQVLPGFYTLKIIDALLCERSFGPFEVKNLTGTNDSHLATHVNIAPNPSGGMSRISWYFGERASAKTSIEIRDAQGTVLQNWMVYNKQFSEINAADFVPGVYYIRIKNAEKEISKAWVVQ